MSAQTLIFMCSIIAFAAVCRNMIMLIPLFVVSCIGIGDIVYYLSVDVMLAFVCAAGFSMILYYKNEIKTRWWMIAIVISVLPVIKFAGFYHTIILVIWCSVYFWRDKGLQRKQKFWRYFVFLFIVASPYILWWCYLHFVTPISLTTRHAFDWRYMQWVSELKGEEALADQAREFWNCLTDFNSMSTVYRMLAISLATGVLSIIASEPGKRKSSVAYSILVVVSFAAYNAFLLGMYLYEMPESSVGSFERYQKIQYVMILLMGVILFVSNIRPIKKMKYQAIPAALLCGMLLWQGWGGLKKELFKYPDLDETRQRLLSQTIEENLNKRAAVYTADSHAKWQADVAIVNYYFYEKAEWSHITSSPEEEEHSLDEWTDFADYLIVIARDDPYTKYCEEHGIDPNRDILFADQI